MFYLERASLRRADYWCSVSGYTAEQSRLLYGLRRGPDAVLYNAVETTESPPFASRSKHEIVYTGTLTAKKGIISLIRAWPLVCRDYPTATLQVLGKDASAPNGRSMAEFLRAQLNGPAAESVQFHGHVARRCLFDRLRQAAAAVFPSYAEAFAFAPLEAMATGCPTISSRRGAGAELLEDGRDGLLVDPDSPAEIAAAIVRLLKDRRLAESLGAAGRQRVQEHFSLAAFLPGNLAFYERCIGHAF